tara:strand:+ start:1077 stop:1328 length:252 start_codon:yes stop_codon:yes gene_type:complete
MKISTLVKRALKNGFKAKPAHGYKWLKDIPVGSMFETASGTRGILLDCEVNARVIITQTNVKDNPESYMGKRIISDQTEVKEL